MSYKSKHEGVRYTCDKCEYCAATQASSLKIHKESEKDNVRYPCYDCEYAATQKGVLNRHKKRKHY